MFAYYTRFPIPFPGSAVCNAIREVSARQRATEGRRRIAFPILRDSGIFLIGLQITNSGSRREACVGGQEK